MSTHWKELNEKLHYLFSSETSSLNEEFDAAAPFFNEFEDYSSLNYEWNGIRLNFLFIISNGLSVEPFHSILHDFDELIAFKQQRTLNSSSFVMLVRKISGLFSLSNFIRNQQNSNFIFPFPFPLIYLLVNPLISFYFVIFREGQGPINFQQHICRDSGACIFDIKSFRNAFGNLENLVMKIYDRTLIPDESLQSNRVLDENGAPSYYLKLYGRNAFKIFPNSQKNPIEIQIVRREADFFQPLEFIFPVAETTFEKINFRIDFHHFDGRNETKYITIPKNEWKLYLIRLNPELILVKTREIIPNTHPTDYNIIIRRIKIHSNDPDVFKFHVVDDSGTITFAEDVQSFMWIDVKLEAPVSGVYTALNARLTATGVSQCDILQEQLTKIFEIYQSEERYYAPFTSLIQSSGFGKTKVCVELLKRLPGLYMVFRKKGDTGIPHQKKWMGDLALFVTGAATDELPYQFSEIMACKAMVFAPGRFLIVLNELIETFFNTYACIRTSASNIERREALGQLGGDMLLEHPEEVAFNFQVIISENDERTIQQVIRSIKMYLNTFSQISGSQELTENSYFKELMKPEINSNFPFLLFLDELDNLNEMIPPGRVPIISIVRRALHLLDLDTRLLVIAIGTNCDALDFSPAIRDNSLRILTRKHLLPPLILSANWDIFWNLAEMDAENIMPIHTLELTRDILLNRAMFNILVAMGRPLWSSCPLSDVVKIAQAKLRNGTENSIGSKLALLMVRSSLTVNVHHVLSRNLVQSYMIIVNYISTNAREMKIGYSSEPMLALASRNLLHDRINREIAFRALLEFLQKQAIDKGRIVETIFQHLTLFAIDDAPNMSEVMPQYNMPDFVDPLFSDNPATVPEYLQSLCEHKSHLLESQEVSRIQEPRDYSVSRLTNYTVRGVAAFLESFLYPDKFRKLLSMISVPILNGLVNCNHFINLERVKPEDFNGLININRRDSKQNIIDRSLLKCGLLRQCGFVLPEGYLAFDYIVPYLLHGTGSSGRPIYSFIGFQSKSSQQTIHDCAVNMAANIHLLAKPNDTEEPNAIFNDDEMSLIYKNQLVFLLSLNNTITAEPLPGKKWNVSVKGQIIPAAKSTQINALNRLAIRDAKNRILDRAYELCSTHLPTDRNLISVVVYPSFSKIKDSLQPEFIITNRIDSDISVQKMIWNSDDPERIRTLTCIACQNVRKLSHLVTENSISIIKKIANYTASMFDDVDPFHLGVVQHSSIYGKFSNYHLCNPLLRRMRGLEAIKNPISDYFGNLNATTMASSISRCITGPIDMQLPPILALAQDIDNQDLDQSMEEIDLVDLTSPHQDPFYPSMEID